MPDLHALIHRMADELDHYRMLLCDDRTDRHALATEARAALAELQGEGPVAWMCPAEPDWDGKKWRPSLQVTLNQRLADYWARPGKPTPLFTRPAPPPADELLQAYQAGRRDAEADAQQAAEAAQEPPAEGEGRDLAVLLSVGADCAGGARLTSAQCRRAADLLTRLALQPVPVNIENGEVQ